MIETMELKPRIAIRDSAAFRGLVYGTAFGAGFALCYLTLFLIIGVFIAPIVEGLVAGQPANIDLYTGTIAVLSGAIGFVVGVLPAAVAGAVAGSAIGALLPVISRRRGPARAAGDPAPSRAHRGADGRRVEWRVWLTGTATTCLVGAAALIIIAPLVPDLIWTAEGWPIVWIPVLIFALSGGPFGLWLRGESTRRPSTERPVQPRRAAIPGADRRGQSST